ncbi:helix-turn-helix domain-containing protein [[Clostridium] innocuum]|jgi:transcriptional regulator with XRE-family HTH domain|nr:helix-turn-helix domain-containing protein [[Clostridium] innocuum]MCR0413785.1 helix-turn-helix domain-containing protein [[Clostridium] innocuum]MCR0534687.1 helix-turn-helix domain-containing protein [[Clostridium] innocuum]MCR0538809.1 helix-turn-helix domain-containing protein [[Clostridium] innocuum]MDU1119290.1 helix-turn-helix transcriptional regulator [Erysipelotrichaceae bacterium]
MKYYQFLKRIGYRIRFIRKQKGMTQFILSQQCGLNQNYISDIENGKRNLTLLRLFNIAKALDVEISELLQ